jgi:hypothetical protein
VHLIARKNAPYRWFTARIKKTRVFQTKKIKNKRVQKLPVLVSKKVIRAVPKKKYYRKV